MVMTSTRMMRINHFSLLLTLLQLHTIIIRIYFYSILHLLQRAGIITRTCVLK